MTQPQANVLPYLCLVGPTAAGKTAVSLAIAHALARQGIEIISVDSALVYRGMDIGTAKPTATELAQAPHHLIDILDPHQSYSAAAFAHDARMLIAQVHSRGRLPLLVGGTMLYFKALWEGLDDLPKANPEIRAALAAQLEQRGLGFLYSELEQVDPLSAQRLSANDTQRILRALEVFHVSGQSLSSLHNAASASKLLPPILSMEPADRAWLHERIAQRTLAMMSQGLIAEVHALMLRGDLHADLPSMRCVGYRQVWQALECGQLTHTDPSGPALHEVLQRCIAATRQLAKRQLTWLRKTPARHVVHCDDPQSCDIAVAWATQQAALFFN